MKKFLLLLLMFFTIMPVFSVQDKYSKEYLQSNKHFSPVNPIIEMIVQHNLKTALKKETGGKYKVKFTGYTTSSIKQGIFKKLDIIGKNIKKNGVEIPYISLKSLSDYNYIDYTKNPMVFKSDMEFEYELHFDKDTLNSALLSNRYNNILIKINKLLYPILVVKDVRTNIMENKLYVLMDYNLPVVSFSKNKTFIMTADFYVEQGKIKPRNIKMENYYVKIPLNKITSILNILNPLEFTLQLLESKKCHGTIEKVNIIDDVIIITGKLFIKKD